MYTLLYLSQWKWVLNILIYTTAGSCSSWDYVSIFDGDSSSAQNIGNFTGQHVPNRITSTGSNVFIQFKSDKKEQHRGFKIQYFIGKCLSIYDARLYHIIL